VWNLALSLVRNVFKRWFHWRQAALQVVFWLKALSELLLPWHAPVYVPVHPWVTRFVNRYGNRAARLLDWACAFLPPSSFLPFRVPPFYFHYLVKIKFLPTFRFYWDTWRPTQISMAAQFWIATQGLRTTVITVAMVWWSFAVEGFWASWDNSCYNRCHGNAFPQYNIIIEIAVHSLIKETKVIIKIFLSYNVAWS
jgi:hypothetical protein